MRSFPDLASILSHTLSIGMQVSGAPLANVQLMNEESGHLEIAAQHGFDDKFLRFFERVGIDDHSVCGRALRKRQAIIVEDVCEDHDVAPCRIALLAAGARAVVSTPLVSSNGVLVGMLSMHFPTKHRPAPGVSDVMNSLALIAADALTLSRARQPIHVTSPLTNRECEILQWIVRGKSSSETAATLKISKRTVDQHVANACKKMGAANRLQLVALAIRDRIVSV
jgi:DNA-binding CsgD family transcriptional regulator